MEFGKVPQSELSRIDFRIPADDPRNKASLAGKPASEMRIGIGAPAWGAKEWVGKIYPRGTAPGEFLREYAQQFSSIELNTTHYRIPDIETVDRWKKQTPEGFRFCPKFPQEISHHFPMMSKEPQVREFVRNVMRLESRLGLSFLQMPPHFEPENLPDLDRLLRFLPKRFPLAVEVRHPAFFQANALTEKYFETLRLRGAAAVITDVAGRRDVLHASLPVPRVMLRLILNDLDATDEKRIEDWSERISQWKREGLEQIELFIHHPSDVNVPDSIARMIDLLNNKNGLELPKWKPRNEGEQLGWF